MYLAVMDKCRGELSAEQLQDLQTIQEQEQTHAVVLVSQSAQAKVQPVESCKYDFSSLKDCQTALQTASLVESAGVGAYLGAAGAVKSKEVLALAGSILPVEAKHLAIVRGMLQQKASPVAFDSPLDAKSVATAISPFIVDCPAGSDPAELFGTNLGLEMQPGQGANALSVDRSLKLQVVQKKGDGNAAKAEASAGDMVCAFPVSTEIAASGAIFSAFSDSKGCEIPAGAKGPGSVVLVSEMPADGKLDPEKIVAGPMLINFS